MNLTLEEISQGVGGTLEGAGNAKVRGYSIDSRTLNAGELFFALRGPRFDGHQFLNQVFERKALAAVVESGRPVPELAQRTHFALDAVEFGISGDFQGIFAAVGFGLR